MKPIPVVFNIGPLQVHTYGIGLAITFWFAYRYLARRLRDHGYPDGWLTKGFVWIIIFSIVGARAVHVISMWGYYSHNLGDIFAVWHGGLSSYGGLLGGVPVGMWCAHRWCPKLRMVVVLDLVAPVLAIAWTVGRLLGPQLMYQGGGMRTNAWYGMYYAGQAGKRVPVPIIQAIECFVIWVIALQIEKFVRRRGGPLGLVVTSVVTLYGLARFFDESVLLPHGTRGDLAVIAASLAFVAAGALFGLALIWRGRGREMPELATELDPWAAPLAEDGEEPERVHELETLDD
ncbi:MAG: prolipoprotein diacylglyceryl transferase [Acidimicrobiales bacterium]